MRLCRWPGSSELGSGVATRNLPPYLRQLRKVAPVGKVGVAAAAVAAGRRRGTAGALAAWRLPRGLRLLHLLRLHPQDMVIAS